MILKENAQFRIVTSGLAVPDDKENFEKSSLQAQMQNRDLQEVCSLLGAGRDIECAIGVLVQKILHHGTWTTPGHVHVW